VNAPSINTNPFHVLGLAPTAERSEVERAGQKMLALVALGHAGVASYDSPLGPRPRDAEVVRTALAALRDPAQRLLAELTYASVHDGFPAPAPAEWRPLGLRILRRRPCFP
jgi:hypothetical protein